MSAYDLYRELGDMDSNAAVVVDTGTELVDVLGFRLVMDTGTEWVDVLGFRLVSDDDDDDEIYEAITDDIICPECRSEAEAEAGTRAAAAAAAWLAAANDTHDPDGDEYIEGAEFASTPERTAEEFIAGIDVDRARTVFDLARACGSLDSSVYNDEVKEAIRDEILRVLAQ